MVLAFGIFILACASTHLMEAITIWIPVYVLSAALKVVTAIASITTAVMFPFVVPQMVLLVRRAKASEERRLRLESTLIERDAAQQALEQSNLLLEQRVKERTAQIESTNAALEAEISERRKNEEILRRSEDRFSKVFRSSPLPIIITSVVEGRLIDVNESFLKMIGRDRESVVGHTVFDIGFWADPQDRITMTEQLNEKGSIIGYFAKVSVGTGEVRDVSISAERIDLAGQACVLGLLQDMTDTKRLQAQFQEAQKMETVGRLAGGIAHDFNNLLGVMMGYSEIAQASVDPALPV
jgi:PAS domain S-box-containing protein